MSGRPLIPKPPFPPLHQIEKPEENQAHKRQGVSMACDSVSPLSTTAMDYARLTDVCSACRMPKTESKSMYASNMPNTRLSHNSQCDGGRPCCHACVMASAECKYTTRGSSLAQRHVGLQESYNELRQAVEAIYAGSEKDAADIVQHMRQAKGLDNIIPSLCSHPRVEQYRLLSAEQQRNWMTDPGSSGYISSEQLSNRTEHVYLLPVSQWTIISQDDTWLSHLLRLFWTWDTTLTRLIHRDLLGDVISTRRGNGDKADSQFVAQFCSELLINSILAYSSVSTQHWKQTEHRMLSPRSCTNWSELLCVSGQTQNSSGARFCKRSI